MPHGLTDQRHQLSEAREKSIDHTSTRPDLSGMVKDDLARLQAIVRRLGAKPQE